LLLIGKGLVAGVTPPQSGRLDNQKLRPDYPLLRSESLRQPVVEFSTLDVQRRLEGVRHEAAIAMAARAVLRAIPALAAEIERREMYGRKRVILPVFRAVAAAWVIARYPTRALTIRHASSAAATAVARLAHLSVSHLPSAAYAANATIGPSWGFSPDPTVAANAAVAIHSAASVARNKENLLIDAFQADASAIEAGTTAADLAGRPIWPDAQWGSEEWKFAKRALLALNEGWDVWIDWYEARRDGHSAVGGLEVARVLIPEERWEQDPLVVNLAIKRLIERYRPTEAELEFSDRQDSFDPEPDVYAADIPPQRPAAIEPVWNGAVLTISDLPALTDQGEEQFATALKGLRKILQDFLDDISSEANIDRRFVSFVRRLAGRIPEVAPLQHELFELGHAESVFAEYTSTVNEQWPNFLAARYHATVLQFERTMRQAASWREFKRNAQKERLTDKQTRQAVDLTNIAASTLRSDEAADFVDPVVPLVLDQLAQLHSHLTDEALAAIETGKEELAADFIESTNNVFKAIAETALPVVIEVAAAARQTAGKANAAFWQEFEKGAVAEAKARGKPAGRAAVRWLLRFATGAAGAAGIGGAGVGAYVGFSRLAAQYPEAFGWLQHLLRFFQQALPPL
jgi:hypothetical protein